VLRKLLDAGVDGIATNHPDVLAGLLERSTHNARTDFDESAVNAADREVRA
jgi:hypothetical protein